MVEVEQNVPCLVLPCHMYMYVYIVLSQPHQMNVCPGACELACGLEETYYESNAPLQANIHHSEQTKEV